MSAALELLDRWKKALHISSDNAAAQRLGIARQALSRWRHEETRPEAALVERMAEDCGLNPLEWMARVESERARSDADRKAWERALRRFAAAVACITVAALGSILPANHALAHTGDAVNASAQYVNQVCIMRTLAARFRRMLTRITSGLRYLADAATPMPA